MKQTLTAKLKLGTTPEQYRALRDTQLAYRDALNHVSAYSFNFMNRSANKVRIQEHTYYDLRARFGLPAQMAINGSRQVGATYKGLWTKVRKNVEHRKMGLTKRRFKGLDKPPRYASPKLLYTYGRGFPFLNGRSETEQGSVSVKTLTVRVVVPYEGYNKHLPLIREGLREGIGIGGAKLWCEARKGVFYLLVSLSAEVADPDPLKITRVRGVDVGQRVLATVAGIDNCAKFHRDGQRRQAKDKLARIKKKLRRKDTRKRKDEGKRPRPIRRRLRAIDKRGRRLTLDTNHRIVKRITEDNPSTLIGVENLTEFCECTDGRKSKKASKKRKKSNKRRSTWPFAELRSLLTYKAALDGGVVIAVDADYTSQGCPRCGHTSKANRPGKGLIFRCEACSYEAHADLVGGRNIAMRTLLVRQDWSSTGLLSVTPGESLSETEAFPDESGAETKAERLSRYSELRWSPGSSPRPRAGGD